MIDIEFGDYHIQKDKESYTFVDDIETVGDSNIAYKLVDGEAIIQDKRVRNDGYVERYAFSMLCTYDERAIIRKMVLGKDKNKRCNAITLTISDEGVRNTMVKVVSGNSSFYEERNIIENVDAINNTLSEIESQGYSNEDVLYELFVLFVKVK